MEKNVVIKRGSEVREFVEVFVNGESKGKRPINGGPSFKDLSNAIATEYGVRTYTVQCDDVPVTAARAEDPVPSGSRVAVNAKDSRGGGKRKETPATPTEASTTEASTSSEAAPAEAQADGAGEGAAQTDPPAEASEGTTEAAAPAAEEPPAA